MVPLRNLSGMVKDGNFEKPVRHGKRWYLGIFL